MIHLLRKVLVPVVGATLLLASAARADIPAGYTGKPFDPAVAGGAGIVPSTVKAGPFAIPGRLDLVNYDMGGDGVAYHSDSHYTTKDGDGYRIDRPAATMCKTVNTKPDIFYGTGTAQDGMFYPTATTADFYIGSIHPGDWFNYTVNVKTAGTYALSSTFSTGNGPPGGEGGDGQMQLQFYVGATKLADWKETFPDFQNTANFHNWKPYPSFATITLAAGLQVIKIQAQFKHLNLDYVQFDLMGADGGTAPDAGASGTDGGAGGTAGAGGTTGAGGATGAGGTTGAAGAGGTTATGAGGTTGVGGASTGGSAGSAGGVAGGNPGTAGASAPGPGTAGSGSHAVTSGGSSGGCACALSPSPRSTGDWLVPGSMTALGGLLARARRRRKGPPGPGQSGLKRAKAPASTEFPG